MSTVLKRNLVLSLAHRGEGWDQIRSSSNFTMHSDAEDVRYERTLGLDEEQG